MLWYISGHSTSPFNRFFGAEFPAKTFIEAEAHAKRYFREFYRADFTAINFIPLPIEPGEYFISYAHQSLSALGEYPNLDNTIKEIGKITSVVDIRKLCDEIEQALIMPPIENVVILNIIKV